MPRAALLFAFVCFATFAVALDRPAPGAAPEKGAEPRQQAPASNKDADRPTPGAPAVDEQGGDNQATEHQNGAAPERWRAALRYFKPDEWVAILTAILAVTGFIQILIFRRQVRHAEAV